LRLITSRAWISISVGWPWKPDEPWWMRIFECGSALRFPGAPPARMVAPIDIAMPTQIVRTSHLMYCIVS
jgi:hypothetical protein